MPKTQITYTTEQIRHIAVVLARCEATILYLQTALAENNIESPPLTSHDEITACFCILEGGREYVRQ